ncbi:MAG: methyltransferase domain-containing protein [Alphaproteobacteria bacterium]|nr:methyltransferase domain-containing protein [Alphaproteobacteria bacterium]
MLDENKSGTPNISEVMEFTQMENARQGFVSALRKHVMVNLAGDMRQDYEDNVKPAYAVKTGAEPETPRDVLKAMVPRTRYRMWSSLRYNAQEMVWASVQGGVERALPEMIHLAKDVAETNPAGGSLRLKPDLEIPRYVSALDVHLMPGCFHTEHTQDDVAQGAVQVAGGDVFRGGFRHRKGNPGGVGESIAHYLKLKHPDFKPKRILDLGCNTGKNLFPYLEVYPDAEAHGIDVGAPLLRYGHAVASHDRLPVHFSQQDAEHLDFEDNSFDIVTSSFFLHELPVKSTKAIFKEAHRILKPGGLMIHMELPPNSEVDAYYGFYLDWDAGSNNNEPFYAEFRNQDVIGLCSETGFEPENCIKVLIPNYASFGAEKFKAFVDEKIPSPPHGNGASWFIFGGWK